MRSVRWRTADRAGATQHGPIGAAIPMLQEPSMKKPYAHARCLLAALMLVVGGGGAAQTTTPNTAVLTARLSGASAVPPAAGGGSAVLQASLNRQTRMLVWSLTYVGLSGPPTGAQFHGPAMPGENAAVTVPIAVGLRTPDTGSVTLSSAQADDLLAGKWYLNLLTAASPAGEVRGQVMIGP
jgi:hypothetical protein